MIRKINSSDYELFMRLTDEFYSGDAVSHGIPQEHHERTFAELMRSEDYAMCYILESDSEPAGYALLFRAFSQEAGGFVIWIDELYILPEFQGRGLGTEFFSFMESEFSTAAGFRLEIHPDNIGAERLYNRLGFTRLPYTSLVRGNRKESEEK